MKQGIGMNIENRQFYPGKNVRERASALLVAVVVTLLVFAAINAGFTPHATDLAGRFFGQASLSL